MNDLSDSNGHRQLASDDALVEMRDVHFSYGTRAIYTGLSVAVRRGDVTVVMGPSGSGKSTMLNFIGRRLKPDAGDVFFDGIDLSSLNRSAMFDLRKRMGMLFQSSALLTDLSVFENVAFPVREHTDLPEPLVRQLVLLKLEMVGLRGARDLMPAELSGGMQRRVALARAIALDPDLVIYDEPFTGLDPISMGVIVKLIRELNDALGTSSIVVTHDVDEGLSIADYVYLLGNGKVIGHGTPDEMRASDSEDIRQFMNGLPDGPVAYHYPATTLAEDLLAREDRS